MTETAVQGTSRYTEAEITRALVELAACSGNSSRAARHLAEDDKPLEIQSSTLWRWSRRQHVEKYERIRAEALPVITAEAAEQHMALARKQAGIAAQAAERIKERLPKMDDRDLINAMGKADIGSGIHTEKAQLLSGQPTHRVERDASEVLRELAAIGFKGQLQESEPPKYVDSTVEVEEDEAPFASADEIHEEAETAIKEQAEGLKAQRA